jgi:transcriptional regulator with XRE-family HTH domain
VDSGELHGFTAVNRYHWRYQTFFRRVPNLREYTFLSDLGKRIGRRIRELRTQRPERWTQEDLAERAKISVSFLSMIERGERVAHVETLAALAGALGVSLAELFVEPAPTATEGEELLRPISEFVRSRQLDSRDVEKLLGVARAMFAPQAMV